MPAAQRARGRKGAKGKLYINRGEKKQELKRRVSSGGKKGKTKHATAQLKKEQAV
jgi:hypothetical protein